MTDHTDDQRDPFDQLDDATQPIATVGSDDVATERFAEHPDKHTDDRVDEHTDDVVEHEPVVHVAPAGPSVEVRRNAGLAAGVAGIAGLLTAAFAARALTGGSALDWVSLAVLAVITAAHAAALADSRAPLLVADDQGVRLRSGAKWRGIAWPDIDCLEHLPRRGLLHDGHLLVDGYDDQQLIVPLTLATRVVGATPATLSDLLAGLAAGRADVVEVVPDIDDEPPAPSAAPTGQRSGVPSLADLYRDDVPETPSTGERRGISAQVAAGLGGLEAAASDSPGDSRGDLARDEADLTDTAERVALPADAEDTGEIGEIGEIVGEVTGGTAVIELPDPSRTPAPAARVEVEAAPRVVLASAAAVDPARATGEESTVVLHDLVVEPVAEPVVGPDLAAARARLRLTIDQLSERTRIRPHVIEAIEVDDFAPCGGDFYARGHLRTLARVLGIDAAPLVAAYDEHYAHEPVDPRRVFESELVSAGGGAIRGTRGGRNWSVLVAFVMAAVLVWSVARLVMGDSTPVAEKPYVLNQSGGVTTSQPGAEPVRLRLTAAGGGATIVVRDGAGKVVFDGDLAFGQTTQLRLVPPVRVQTSDGSVTFALGKAQPEALGATGTEVSRTLVPR